MIFQLSFNCIYIIMVVLDCNIIYILLIIKNTMRMSHVKVIVHVY
jgi:hypothetical protein